MEHVQAATAKVVGVHGSTICRELRRSQGQRADRAKQAHEEALSHPPEGHLQAASWPAGVELDCAEAP